MEQILDFTSDRRRVLQGLSWLLIGGGVAPMGAFAQGQSDDSEIYTPPGLQTYLPESDADLPVATFDVKAPFDLDDPFDYRFARLKTNMNTVGKRTYHASMSRHFLCPPGVPPVPLVNEFELNSISLLRPDGMDEDTALISTNFTRVPVDPVTNEPIREIENPYIEGKVQLKDTLFAATGFELRMGRDDPHDLILQSDKPYFRFGGDVGFINFDPRDGEGDHQPRMDTYIYRTKYDDLMDPKKDLIQADISYIALMRASVFRWTGIPEGDPTQFLSQKIGVKVTSLDDMPEQVKKVIVDKYPNRA